MDGTRLTEFRPPTRTPTEDAVSASRWLVSRPRPRCHHTPTRALTALCIHLYRAAYPEDPVHLRTPALALLTSSRPRRSTCVKQQTPNYRRVSWSNAAVVYTSRLDVWAEKPAALLGWPQAGGEEDPRDCGEVVLSKSHELMSRPSCPREPRCRQGGARYGSVSCPLLVVRESSPFLSRWSRKQRAATHHRRRPTPGLLARRCPPLLRHTPRC